MTMDVAPTAHDAGAKAKLFISYSRKDLAFVDRLDAALRARGFEPLIDRAEIYAFEDWWTRIQTLITKADTIVFVLSPDAVASDICAKEVEFAASLNKRFAPVVCRPVDDRAVPAELRRLNFIFGDDEARFDNSMAQLADALTTDIVWVRKHTEFGELAQRWAVAGRPGPRGLLLSASVLEEAERWITSRPANAPPPTEATQAFIAESRRAATRRRRVVTGIFVGGFIAALGLAGTAGVAYWQRGIAQKNEEQAKEQHDQKLQTQSIFLADLSSQKIRNNDGSYAILLALEALPDSRAGTTRPYAPEAEFALGAARQQLQEFWLLGHEDSVNSAVFSPDGQRLLTASSDKTARLWDAASGTVIAVMRGHESGVLSAAFSPDGQRIVTASYDNTARLWDTASGQEILVLRGHEAPVWSAAFSPDGMRIVTASGNTSHASKDNTARVWDAASGKEIAVLRGHLVRVHSATFSPDGRRVVTAAGGPTGTDYTARLWDAETGEPIGAPLKGHESFLFGVAFSPDGKSIVTASWDKTARLWDAETGNVIAVLRGHEGHVTSAAFSPDGQRVLTASDDKTARLWDAASGTVIVVMRGHEYGVSSAAFSPDGLRIVTASYDNTARLWDTASGKEILVLRGHEVSVTSAVFSPDGQRVLTASGGTQSDKTARLWDAARDKENVVLRGHERVIRGAAFNPDGRRAVTASWDMTVRLWDTANGKEIMILSGHEAWVHTAEFSPDGQRILTAAGDLHSFDNTARVWDAASGTEIAVLRGHESFVDLAKFSRDGQRVVTASRDNTARVWDAASGKEIAVLRGHEGWVSSAAFSPDGQRVLTASADRTARLWDGATGKEILVLRGTGVSSAAFSPDGRWILTAEGSAAQLRDAVSGNEILTLSTPESDVEDASFGPDGKYVLTKGSRDNTVRIWDIASGKQVALLRGHEDVVTSVALSWDGRRAVTTSEDKTARLWDAATGKIIMVFRGHEHWVMIAAFSPDGQQLLTVAADTARLWRIFPTTQDLVDNAKKSVPRCLTRRQREQAFLNPAPPAWCIEMTKWPYRAQDWKDWLKFQRANLNPPLPDTPEWRLARYDAAIQLDRTDANAFLNRGDVFFEKKEYDRAIADYSASLKLDPTYVSAYDQRSAVYFIKEDYGRAITDYSDAIRLEPTARRFNSRCWAFAIVDRLQEALADCNESLRLKPDDSAALDSRAFTFLKLGQIDSAIAEYDAALKIAESAWSYYGRGLAKRRKGDSDGGNADFASAQKLQTDIAHEFARYGIK